MNKCALMLSVLLLAVGTAIPAAWGQEAIKVGIVLPLTGDQAKFGEIEKQSFDMALEEINGAGGVSGKKLQFLIEDDTGRPDVGRSAAEKLITKDKVVVLGGGYSSSVTFAVAGVAQQNRMPFLVNTGADDKITEQGWDYVFRLNPFVSEYTDAMQSFLAEVVKPKTAAILYENTNYGTSAAKDFKLVCERMGIQLLINEGYESGGVDFKPILGKVKQANPDLIYMASYLMDASLLMRQSMELRLNPKMFAGGGCGFHPSRVHPERGQSLGEGLLRHALVSDPPVSGGHGLLQQVHEEIQQGDRVPRRRGVRGRVRHRRCPQTGQVVLAG